MAKNNNLHDAKNNKNDDFYTRLVDIERQMYEFKDKFRGKVVLCNCDDPYESNFFKYFAMNFNHMGLKKLIATCYDGSTIQGEQLSLFDVESISEEDRGKKAYKIEITEVPDLDGSGAIDISDVEFLIKNKKNVLTVLNGNGSFDSPECIKIIEEEQAAGAEIIVATNPPFSRFKDYIAFLFKYNLQFIIIGPQNALTYKEIFPLVKNNKLWLGYPFAHGDAYFTVSKSLDTSRYAAGVYDPVTNTVHFRNCHWFTNIDCKKRHENIILWRKYSENSGLYSHYDNYNGINVDRIADIPCDYSGVMGVPITFLDKYNPEQFEIIDLSRYLKHAGMSKEFVETYYKQGGKGQISEGHPDLCYYNNEGKAIVPYMRILIRIKQLKKEA